MRLLHVESLELHEFFDADIPPYAILSHTWEAGEPTFQDFQVGVAQHKAGYTKVLYAAKWALQDGLSFVWIDTICIDKANSTELFEAINSMYQWYTDSQVCFGYLADVVTQEDIPKSRWFTRGWTLQELLAPAHMIFFNKEWRLLGKKSRKVDGGDFNNLLLQGAGIAPQHVHVLDFFRADDWTIAERMSWASRRSTTRREDLAYCLLGIFAINMPLLYGEGDRAFLRLQEEIMRVSDDQSLFAWRDPDAHPQSPSGLLARSPSLFRNCLGFGEVDWKLRETGRSKSREPYRMTNQGIHITLPIIKGRRGFYALLGYGPINSRPGIVVKHIIQNEFARTFAGLIFSPAEVADEISSLRAWFTVPRAINVRQRLPIQRAENQVAVRRFWVDYSQLTFAGITLKDVQPPPSWNPKTGVVQPQPTVKFTFDGPNDWLGDVRFSMIVTQDGEFFLAPVFEEGSKPQATSSRSQLSSILPRFVMRPSRIHVSDRGPHRTIHLSMSLSRYPWRTLVLDIMAELKPCSSLTESGSKKPGQAEFPDTIILSTTQPWSRGWRSVVLACSKYMLLLYMILLFPRQAYRIFCASIKYILLVYERTQFIISQLELRLQGLAWEVLCGFFAMMWVGASIEHGSFPLQSLSLRRQRSSKLDKFPFSWEILQMTSIWLVALPIFTVLIWDSLFWTLLALYYIVPLQIQLLNLYVPPERQIPHLAFFLGLLFTYYWGLRGSELGSSS